MSKAALFVIAATAAALAAAQESRPDPRDPKAKVPPLEYRSAFDGYRRYSEPELADWREMNDEVRRIGGHVGIAREQQQAPRPQAKPAPEAGHGGHR